jgi:hypothetical protein
MKCDDNIIHQRIFKYLIITDYFVMKYNNDVKKKSRYI